MAQTKNVKVSEQEYTLQKLPVMEALKLRERCRKQGDLDTIRFYTELLEHVVISPKTTIDSFEDTMDLEDLMKEVISYQYGRKGKLGNEENN